MCCRCDAEYQPFLIVSIDQRVTSANLGSQPKTAEVSMQNDVVTIGRRLLPLEQIALVEPFDPTTNPDFKSDRPFKARLVLINRETVLAEFTPAEFAEAHRFGVLNEDDVAVNPTVAFRVETFTPTEAFRPEKAYETRLKWRDLDGNEHSKLLLTKPETVFSIAVRRGSERRPEAKTLRRPTGARAPKRSSRKFEAVRS